MWLLGRSAIADAGLWWLIQSSEWPSRRMANMEDVDRVAAKPLEDSKWVADHGCCADVGTLRDAGCRERCALNAVNDVEESSCNGFCHSGTRAGRIVVCDVAEIGKGLSGIENLHLRRNFAKAAAISASVATSPPSTAAMAASMIFSSSWFAKYSPPLSSFSISLAIAINSFCASSGQDWARCSRSLKSVTAMGEILADRGWLTNVSIEETGTCRTLARAAPAAAARSRTAVRSRR